MADVKLDDVPITVTNGEGNESTCDKDEETADDIQNNNKGKVSRTLRILRVRGK